MPNQKRKLPLIQVPGTDMVDTTATHTDMEVTVDTTMVRLKLPHSIAIPSQDIQHCLTYIFKQYFKTYQSNVLI